MSEKMYIVVFLQFWTLEVFRKIILAVDGGVTRQCYKGLIDSARNPLV